MDPRRPFRLLHLDLLVLLAFGVSEYFFNKGNVDVSVPLVYPLLGYLLIRLGLAGFRPRPRGERLMPYARTSWLVVGLVLLMVFRVGLNVVQLGDHGRGLRERDRARTGSRPSEDLYVANDIHGDTYGPSPTWPTSRSSSSSRTTADWGEVPAAHAAVARLRPRHRDRPDAARHPAAIAVRRADGSAPRWRFAWTAYPFTLLGLQANVNDGLVAALLIFALLALSSPAKRGLMVGLAAAAKFAPIVLAPLLATGTGEEPRSRSWLYFGAAFAGIVALPLVLYLPDGGLKEFYDCTIGFQFGRDSVFSLWGLHPSLGWLQDIVKVAGLVFAAALAFVPRRRDLRQVAALGAAALIAAQLSVEPLVLLLHPVVHPVRAAGDVRRVPGRRARARPQEPVAQSQRVASPV